MINYTETLLMSQVEAKRLLDESAERARPALANADRRAAELLMKQRELAAQLLFEQHELELAVRKHVQDVADGMSEAAGKKRLARHDREATLLREKQERVAAELVEAEKELAKHVECKEMGRACAILIDGHYEAAAILGEARMRVEVNPALR